MAKPGGGLCDGATAAETIKADSEGDLMAAAGVTFTVGREATTHDNETLAGLQSAITFARQSPPAAG